MYFPHLVVTWASLFVSMLSGECTVLYKKERKEGERQRKGGGGSWAGEGETMPLLRLQLDVF